MDVLQDKLQHISGYAGKLLRRKFGRGPVACYAAASCQFLVLTVRGFLSPMEEVLLQQGHTILVDAARQTIMQTVVEELTGVIQSVLDLEVVQLYHDWNYVNNAGMILAVMNESLPASSPPAAADITKLQALEEEVERLSTLVQKRPEHILPYQIHDRMFIVIRKGLLTPIEQALIARGYDEQLRLTKDELERSSFHRDGRFQDVFGRQVEDMFFAWSFKDDEGLVCFVLNG